MQIYAIQQISLPRISTGQAPIEIHHARIIFIPEPFAASNSLEKIAEVRKNLIISRNNCKPKPQNEFPTLSTFVALREEVNPKIFAFFIPKPTLSSVFETLSQLDLQYKYSLSLGIILKRILRNR
jgi:hypothetical protein